MGGHYGVDILAGTILWVAVTPSLWQGLTGFLSNVGVLSGMMDAVHLRLREVFAR